MQSHPSDRHILRRLERGIWLREPGGYYCPGQPKILNKTVDRLCGKGLATTELVRGRYQLRLTPTGSISLKQKETT